MAVLVDRVESPALELAQLLEERCKVGGLRNEIAGLVSSGGDVQALRRLTEVWGSSAAASLDEKLVRAAYSVLVSLATRITRRVDREAALESALEAARTHTAEGLSEASRFRLLLVLYNAASGSLSPVRARVFGEAARVACSEAENDPSLAMALLRQSESVAQDSKSWSTVTGDDRRNLILVPCANMARLVGKPAEELSWLLRALEEEAAESAPELAVRAVVAAVSTPTFYEFDRVLALPVVRALASDASKSWALDLVRIFAEGTMEQLQAFYADAGKAQAAERAGVPRGEIQDRLRLLQLCAEWASQNDGSAMPKSLTFARAAELMQVREEEVERWVVMAVRAGLVDARMNAVQKTITIRSAAQRTFGTREWRALAGRIADWRKHLQALAGAITGSAP